jgi:hypothetical protein
MTITHRILLSWIMKARRIRVKFSMKITVQRTVPPR